MRRIGAAATRFSALAATLMGRRPPQLQVGALCRREGEAGTEVLLITSLDTGRWVIPKGWPMKGRSLAGAALREAWEESGVVGATSRTPVGSYHYLKRRRGGLDVRVEVAVFPVQVRKMETGFPEEGRRKLVWVAPETAANMVAEPGLARLLRSL